MKNSIKVLAEWRRAMAIAILTLMASASVVAENPKQSELNRKQSPGDIVAKALSSPRSSNEILNPADSPVTILDSSSVEISSKVFRELTGISAQTKRATAYPQITLMNNSDVTVTEVGLIVANKLTGMKYKLKMNNISIGPHQTYVVDSERWMIPALIWMQPSAEAEWIAKNHGQPKTVSRKEIVRYDSEVVWLPGRPADQIVGVMSVEQSNGGSWKLRLQTGSGQKVRTVAYKPQVSMCCGLDGAICYGVNGFDCWVTCNPICSFEECVDCGVEKCSWFCGVIIT